MTMAKVFCGLTPCIQAAICRLALAYAYEVTNTYEFNGNTLDLWEFGISINGIEPFIDPGKNVHVDEIYFRDGSVFHNL